MEEKAKDRLTKELTCLTDEVRELRKAVDELKDWIRYYVSNFLDDTTSKAGELQENLRKENPLLRR